MLSFIKNIFRNLSTKSKIDIKTTASKSISKLQGNLAINGDIVFTGSLDINGTIIGNIASISEKRSELLVEENAHIKGDVSCQSIRVFGRVEGNINST